MRERTMSLIGVTVPSTFDMCVMATILVRGDQQLLEIVEQEVALVVDRRPFDHGALRSRQEMPGNDVGMVLHNGEDDLVARADRRCGRAGGDKIERPVAERVKMTSSAKRR